MRQDGLRAAFRGVVTVTRLAARWVMLLFLGDELAGTGVTAAELARVFPSTDLSAATDDIADGLYDWEHADPYPLALFDGARVDFSLRRLVHYTGSDWRHVQPWILLTNYHRYVDQFIRHGLDMLRDDTRFTRMVLPGNVIIERGMEEGEAQATGVPLPVAPITPEELPAGLAPTGEGWLRTDPGMLAEYGGLDGFFVTRWRAKG